MFLLMKINVEHINKLLNIFNNVFVDFQTIYKIILT